MPVGVSPGNRTSGAAPQTAGLPDRPEHVKRIPFVAITASLAAGILVSHYAAPPFVLWPALSTACLAGIAAGLILRRPYFAAAFLFAAFLCAGGLLHFHDYHYVPAGHIATLVSDERAFVELHGRIRSDPQSSIKRPLAIPGIEQGPPERETAFDIDLEGVTSPAGRRTVSGRVRVKLAGDNPSLRYGDDVTLVGTLQAPNYPTNPGQFDYREYLRRAGIRAILYVSGPAGATVTARHAGPMRLVFAVRRRLISLLKPTPEHRGGKLLAAMLLGATDELSPDVLSNFQNSGAMHLLAVSGLNVGIIAATILWLAGLARVPLSARSFVVLGGVVCYTLLAGAQPPAVRAAVMIAVAVMGGAVSRRQISVNSLALAAFVILVFAPCELFSVGFQLSFAAILSIIHFYRPIRAMLDKLKSALEDLQAREEQSRLLRCWIAWKRIVFPLMAVSLCATIGVTPLVARTFNVVSIGGILLNVVYVPLAWLVVMGGFVALVLAAPLSLVWSSASLLSTPAAYAALLLENIADTSTRLPASYYHTAGPPLWFLLLYYALLVLLIHRHALHLTRMQIAIAILLLLNALAASSLWPGPRRFSVTCYDVRHGNCVFIRFPSGETMLYDCGTQSRFFDVGAYVVSPHLWQQGIHTIDALVLSHPDADHINGVASLLDRFRIGRVYLPPNFESEPLGKCFTTAFEQRGIPCESLCAGQSVALGDARMEVLSPPRDTILQLGRTPNDRSLVVKVSCAGTSLLFTGDIETPAIAWLLMSGQNVQANVLFLPHHGSFTTNASPLVRAVNPASVVISGDQAVDSDQAMKVLSAEGWRVRRTCDEGAIEF